MKESSFKKIFSQYYNVLVNYALHIVKEKNIAEDMVQDVFLKFWEKNIDLTEPELKYLLFKMVKNRSIDFNRKQATVLKSEIDLYDQVEDTDKVDNYILKQRIFNSLRHLPPKCKEVFTLSKVNGLTYAEISKTLDISTKTVENHMRKAFKILQDQLRDLNK